MIILLFQKGSGKKLQPKIAILKQQGQGLSAIKQ
jgi:hypothetical protein